MHKKIINNTLLFLLVVNSRIPFFLLTVYKIFAQGKTSHDCISHIEVPSKAIHLSTCFLSFSPYKTVPKKMFLSVECLVDLSGKKL
jgi:hypothetical protein